MNSLGKTFIYPSWPLFKGRGRPSFFTTWYNRRGLISITGNVIDKNCSELSQPEMSITRIKLKNQCSFRTSLQFLITPKIIFLKPQTMDKQGSCSHAKKKIC